MELFLTLPSEGGKGHWNVNVLTEVSAKGYLLIHKFLYKYNSNIVNGIKLLFEN